MKTLPELPLRDVPNDVAPPAPSGRPSERFAFDDTRAYDHLAERGYVVIGGVASADETAHALALLWSHLESLGTGIDRRDPETWDDNRWVGDPTTGILPDYGVPQSAFLWYCRALPKVVSTFARIWGTPDLLVSFDGAGAFRPTAVKARWKTRASWYHTDQNGLRERGFSCVQGLVNLAPAGPDRGGLVVVPGSHRRHAALFEAQREALASAKNFVRISPEWLAGLGDEAPLKICCEAGDLVLWDSRTVHCNTRAPARPALPPGPPALERVVAYVCMTPRDRAPDLPELARKRHTAFLQGLGTNHLPHDFEPKPPPPAREGVPVTFAYTPVELDAHQRALAGFDQLEHPPP